MRWLPLVFLVACGSDNIHHLPDAPCIPGSVTLAITAPAAYGCHDPFKSTITLTNDSCEAVTVQSIAISGTVTTGQCTPPAPGSFPPTTATVAVGATTDVLDFTGGAFCCTTPGCPASFQCDEAYTYVAETSAGSITGTGSAHLSLDSCNQICP